MHRQHRGSVGVKGGVELRVNLRRGLGNIGVTYVAQRGKTSVGGFINDLSEAVDFY